MSYEIGRDDDRKSLRESRRYDAFGKPTDSGEFVLVLATYLETAFDALKLKDKRIDWTVADNAKKAIRIVDLEAALKPMAKAHKSDRPYNEISLHDCRVAFDLLQTARNSARG